MKAAQESEETTMNEHVRTARRLQAETCLKHLHTNGFSADYFETAEEALVFLKGMIPAGSSIGFGGSETLKETGILDWLTGNTEYTVYDRYHTDNPQKVFHDSLSADYYLMSTNALTMDGHLYNVDNTGNRVAALAYGPEHVIIVTGTNKLVKDVQEAVLRNEYIAHRRTMHASSAAIPVKKPDTVCTAAERLLCATSSWLRGVPVRPAGSM